MVRGDRTRYFGVTGKCTRAAFLHTRDPYTAVVPFVLFCLFVNVMATSYKLTSSIQIRPKTFPTLTLRLVFKF